MASLIEVTRELAARLLEEPGQFVVSIWRQGEDWHGHLGGVAPTEVDWAISDRVDNGDADPTTDPSDIESYAYELAHWVEEHAEGSNEVPSIPPPSSNGRG